MIRAFHIGTSPEDLESTRKMWTPFHAEIGRLTVEAARDHDKVVLSHATYNQVCRDVVIEALAEGGIKREQITIVQLDIDPKIKQRDLYFRIKAGVEVDGTTTIEEVCRGVMRLEFEGEMTVDKFVELTMSNISEERCFEDCPGAKKVDVSGRDVSHVDNVDAAIGRARDASLAYEEILEKVKPIDAKRDEEAIKSGASAIFAELMAGLNSAGDEEVAKKAEEKKETPVKAGQEGCGLTLCCALE